MKKLLPIIFIFASLAATAATSITTPTVAGHWTLAGSPYLIYNNINIDSAASLTIDPGVDVIFQGAYNLNVNGMLNAAGTSSLPITFNVNDTTGFWNDTTSTGGWHGIQFQPFGGTGADASTLQYCNISFTKFDSTDAAAVPTLTTLYILRALTVSNCNITSNKSPYNYMMYVVTDSAQAFDLGNCTISNNTFSRPVIFIDNFYGGSSHVYANTVYQNQSGNAIISCAAVNMLFENNELYNNTSVSGTIVFSGNTSLVTKECHATIRNNKIHHNTNTYDAALVCMSGFIDINANLVCNNQHTSAAGSYMSGGGGINIAYNSPGSFDSTFYTVRNNVIANNYSPYHGGAISIFDAQGIIANNQIINNTAVDGGAIYLYTNFPISFKNNIFYGNITTPDINSLNTPNIAGTATASVAYDHNWSQHSTLFDMALTGAYILTTDTTTNITAPDPLLVAPTLTADVTENALTASFSLQPSSPCINTGDTTGADPYLTDYAGNARIMSSIIDMGAFEFNPITLHTQNVVAAPTTTTIFPNPATTTINIAGTNIIGTVTITNLLGRQFFNEEYTTDLASINIASLAPGMYIITINGSGFYKMVKE